MQQHQFDDLGELEDVKNRLARASRHPVHADLGTEYDEHSGGEQPVSGDTKQLGKHALWNNRDDSLAYFGSDRFNLIQHREVLDTITTAVENTEGSIEKGVIHDYGSKIDGVLVFGDQDKASIDVGDLVDTDGDTWRDGYVPPEGADYTRDVLGLGMRFFNGWDGRTKVGGSTMGYRFICQNWMVWGEQTIAQDEAFHLKGPEEHVGLDPAFFEDIIHEVFDEKGPAEEAVRRAIEEEVPLSWVPAVLDDAGFGDDYARRISHRVRNQTPPRDDHTTLWHIYNAATAFIDHDKAGEIGPSVYQRHHETAWDVLEVEVREPEKPLSLTAYARAPEQ